MAKNQKNTTSATKATDAQSSRTSGGKSAISRNKTAGRHATGGVVAYTKGSRFEDAEVRAAVSRVLKEL